MSPCDWFILMKSSNLINDWVSCLDLKTLTNAGIVHPAENWVWPTLLGGQLMHTCVLACVPVCVFVGDAAFWESNQRFMM